MEQKYYKANAHHPLPPEYIPPDMIAAPIPFVNKKPMSKCFMARIAAENLYKLYNDAAADGLCLYGISAYRSYSRQEAIYNGSIAKNGYGHTEKYIAKPGTSEHQTGLAIDLSCPANNFELTEAFAYTEEGKWLRLNASEYGFILSYPDNHSNKNGYAYEPWHICFTCKEFNYYV